MADGVRDFNSPFFWMRLRSGATVINNRSFHLDGREYRFRINADAAQTTTSKVDIGRISSSNANDPEEIVDAIVDAMGSSNDPRGSYRAEKHTITVGNTTTYYALIRPTNPFRFRYYITRSASTFPLLWAEQLTNTFNDEQGAFVYSRIAANRDVIDFVDMTERLDDIGAVEQINAGVIRRFEETKEEFVDIANTHSGYHS